MAHASEEARGGNAGLVDHSDGRGIAERQAAKCRWSILNAGSSEACATRTNLLYSIRMNIMAKKTMVLIVLDGWGIGPNNQSNPLFVAKPQIFEWLAANYPVTSLQASGISVGLPWGEIGNSEVGHLTLGAGKVLYQYYPRITMSIQDGTFFDNQVLKEACAHAKEKNSAVNLVGLLTKGNVHASIDHLKALIKMVQQEGVTKINLHLFADAKDSAPHSLQDLLKEFRKNIWRVSSAAITAWIVVAIGNLRKPHTKP